MSTLDHEPDHVLGPYAEELMLDVQAAAADGNPQKIAAVEQVIEGSLSDKEIDFGDVHELRRRLDALLSGGKKSDTEKQRQEEQHVV